MTAFWKNLQQLAHGQLFNGGHVSTDAAHKLAQSAGKADDKQRCRGDFVRRPPHPQIAAYR